MLRKKELIKALIMAVLAMPVACTHKWDDHNAGTGAPIEGSLYQQINSNASLSKFAGLLKQSGYADTLSLAKNFTVWAPSNEAVTAVEGTLQSEAARKAFVQHYITNLSYFTAMVQGAPQRIRMLDGKYVYFSAAAFADATLSTKDQSVTNGVLHTLNTAVKALPNCWDYIDTLRSEGNIMATYLRTRDYKVQDLTHAVQTGVDPVTGNPIYQAGTDSAMRNRFLDSVYDVSNEAKEYTVFILADAAMQSETSRLKPFYVTGTDDSTTLLASQNVVKDLAIEGAYTQANLPDSIVSGHGVKVGINKAAIVRTYKTSNGYVYVMNEMGVPLASKIPDIIIEGENYTSLSNDRPNSVYTRTNIDSARGGTFRDVFVYKHQVNKFHLRYRVRGVYTATYNVYWRVVNNTTFLTSPYNQRLAMGDPAAVNFPYTPISRGVWDEKLLGQYKVSTYGNGELNLYLVSADITPNGSNHIDNSLLLDYVRLEPVR